MVVGSWAASEVRLRIRSVWGEAMTVLGEVVCVGMWNLVATWWAVWRGRVSWGFGAFWGLFKILTFSEMSQMAVTV